MSSDTDKTYTLGETCVQNAGVFRCCIDTVGDEFDNAQLLKIGTGSKCKHCGEPFTLTTNFPKPKWVPDWQLNS